MDKVILTSFTLEEIANVIVEKLSTIQNKCDENPVIENDNNDQEFLTREETAKLCKVSSLTTLHNWKHKGILIPKGKAGKKPLYIKKDVLEFLIKKKQIR